MERLNGTCFKNQELMKYMTDLRWTGSAELKTWQPLKQLK